MKKQKVRIKNWKWWLIVAPIIIIILILSYYQFVYKSERVDTGIAKLEYHFKKHGSVVTSVRFMPNDSFVVTSSVDSTVRIWKRNTGEIVNTFKEPHGVSYMDLSNDGQLIITGSYDSQIRVWSIAKKKIIQTLKGHQGTVWAVNISRDNSKIVSAGDDNIVRIWDVQSGSLLHEMIGHKRIIWGVKFSPDGKTVVSGSFDFTVKTWDVETGKLIRDNTQHTETVVDVAFSNNGKMLASVSDDRTIKIWDAATGDLIRSMEVPEHVQAVAFSPDDKRLMTGGRDKPMMGEFVQNFVGDSKFNKGVSARLWDVSTGKLLQTFQDHENDVQDVDYSKNGKFVATASADGTVMIWEVK